MNLTQEFNKFAVSNGISSNTLNDYQKYQNAFLTPNVIEKNSLNITSIDVFSRLMMNRILFLRGTIDSDVSDIISAQLLFLDLQGKKDIEIYLNTPGGSVADGLAIYDTMNYIDSDIMTTIAGTAASMGAILATSGTKGKRSMLPHSRLMIHQPMTGMPAGTKADESEIVNEQIQICKKELYTILAENGNLSYDEIVNRSRNDYWLRAEDALACGFVDQIITKK